MRPWFVFAFGLAITPGCSDHSQPPPPPVVVAPPAIAPHPSMFGGTVGSASGMHLDDDGSQPGPQPAAARRGQTIDVVLRSSPPGAMAAVDGVPIGPTPTNWSGTADGRPHTFTFTRPGYALARYQFVPITSGVIHARLEPIGEDAGDAGVAPAPTIAVAPERSISTPPADAAPAPTSPPLPFGAGPQP